MSVAPQPAPSLPLRRGEDRLEVTISLATPAFLGNARQEAEWRAAPFKALLRRWWRVAVARSLNFEVGAIHEAEGVLFGQVGNARNGKLVTRKSSLSVVLRSPASTGAMDQWPQDPKLKHPETNGQQVGAHLYLGYGPLVSGPKHATQMKKGKGALAAGRDLADLVLRFPTTVGGREIGEELRVALTLIDAFGCIGGRSSNGWGSLCLSGADHLPRAVPRDVFRLWTDALRLDWVHAIGHDQQDRPLVWRTTSSFENWQDLMRGMAELKIAYRTSLGFPNGAAGGLKSRHLLGYPVTNHRVEGWGNQSRLGSQLRLKAVPDALEPNGLRGLIYQVPFGLPVGLRNKLPALDQERLDQLQQQTWTKVHGFLDQQAGKLERFSLP